MPLPDAEPPEESRLYEELKSKTALPGASGAITPDLIDNLKNATFLDYANEDQLRRLVLIMMATGTGSLSGPLPNSMRLQEVETTSSGSRVTQFQPGIGEVWQINCTSFTITGGSGTVQLEGYFESASDTSKRVEFISASTTSGGAIAFEERQVQYFVDENVIVKFEATGTFTNVNFKTWFTRVR